MTWKRDDPGDLGRPSASAHARRALTKDLALVFVVALGLRFLWLSLIPPWLSPDEPAHFTYVTHLVEQGEIPREKEKSPDPIYPVEVTRSFELTFYRQISFKGGRTRPELRYLPVGHDYSKALLYRAPDEDRRSAAGASATSYSPLYYQAVSIGYRLLRDSPLLSRLYACRGISALIGALSCIFGYLFAFELRRTRNAALAVGLSMALLPMHTFMSASLNNDSGLFLCATALCWAIARAYATPTFTRSHARLLGLASGLTMLIKPTAAILIGVAALLCFVRTRSLLRSHSRPEFIRLSAEFVAPVLLTYGAWTLYRTLFLGGDGGGSSYTQEGHLVSSVNHLRYGFWDYLKNRYAMGPDHFKRIFVRELWGDFGLREVRMGHRPYFLVMVGYALSLVGLVRLSRRSKRDLHDVLLAIALFAAQLVFVFVIADYALFFASTGHSMGIQGRYFLPVTAPILMLLFLGAHGLRMRRDVPWQTLPVLVGIVQIVALRTIAEAWYGVRIGL